LLGLEFLGLRIKNGKRFFQVLCSQGGIILHVYGSSGLSQCVSMPINA
jgi:hypothetical protein